ncbi:MAG: hypothetical protein ABR549_09270 [Mycobacteriales bacterium]
MFAIMLVSRRYADLLRVQRDVSAAVLGRVTIRTSSPAFVDG